MPTLRSSEAPAKGQQPGLDLAPFRGVRYAEDRVSGLAQVTSPPYDVIAADFETRLMAADPYNVVRLILPVHAEGSPGSPFQDAAADLTRWLADGILTVDPGPALYVYEQADVERVVQRGLIGALGLVPYSAGIVQPHENVMPGPVAGRRRLMEATRANLEPIFLLYQGGKGVATKLVDEVADSQAPLAGAVTADGLRHRLWAVTDPADLAAIAADLAPRTALIADGHHRYAAYLELQRRLHAAGAGPGPWDRGLALLVDSAAYPPRVGAIHRVVDGLVPETAARLASAAFTVRELSGGAADVPGVLAELDRACAGGIAFLLAGRGRAWLLTDPDPARLRSAVSDEPADLWQRLGGAVMADLLFGRLWGIQDDERSVRAFHDGADAIRAAGDGAGGVGTAVLCCPMSADQVYQVAALGRRVPRKSTSFGPKPRTGMVMRLFAQG
ncbi:MAG TPA: DUF1015 domain-containing protein [Streptosporangiaceae bacterium]|nr:DUF1015 domain-containing protein [Streptosporangiaceae bacterium]